MTLKYYAGIGSRQTPEEVCNEMRTIAMILYECGYWLRSGGADKADSSFEEGAQDHKEIYLPWEGFNGSKSTLITGNSFASRKLAKSYHPYWDSLTTGGKMLHSRNMNQILGKDLKTPSEFVVCWTPDGKASGGTGQALRLALDKNIEIINLKTMQFPFDRFV